MAQNKTCESVIYTAGRLAERRSNTRFSCYKLIWRFISYVYVCGNFSAIQIGLISNKPYYTLAAVGVAVVTLVWETCMFVKNNKARQQDDNALQAAGYRLVGSGTGTALLHDISDIGESRLISKLEKSSMNRVG